MFEWSDARVFLAVCARGSFTAAAKDLAMDQTTVGRRIASLEAALDTKLFRRGPAGLALTADGEEARALAEAMESAAYRLERSVRGRDRATRGLVRITTSESFGRAFLAPRLARLASRHPEIDVSLKTDNRVLSLTKREADVALRHFRPSQRGLVARKVADVGFAAYASPSYLASRRRGAERVLGFEDELATLPDAEWLAERGPARAVLRSNSRGVLEGAAAGGLGIAILPCFLADVRTDLARADDAEPFLRPLWIVTHPDLRRHARVTAVVEFVVEEVRRAKDLLAGRAR